MRILKSFIGFKVNENEVIDSNPTCKASQLTMLNEDNLVLNNYAKQLYSLFKKEGATPLIMTGKNHTSPDVKNYNVSIMVTNNGELHVGIKGVNKANAEKYANLVSKQFQDLQLKGNINFGTGWGGEQDSYADLTLIPKTTKKGGEVNPNRLKKVFYKY